MKKVLIISIMGLFIFGLGSCSRSKQSIQDKGKPNVILILVDDMGWECIGSYGGVDYKTPNIDMLAENGVQFSHCYSSPLCSPSRVKIMTGKYNFRNYTNFGYLDPEEKTFGHLMKEAGYRTAIAGKWQLNGLYHEAEGYKDNRRPHMAGFDEYCLWQLTKRSVYKGPDASERFWSPPLEKNGKLLSVEDNNGLYGPDIMSDFICDFVRKSNDKPFFVYYPMVLVHDPFVYTPDNLGNAERTQAGNIEPGLYDEKKNNYAAMVNYMDKIVGKIVKQVKDIGQLENTVIIFTSDNGTSKKITSNWNNQSIKGGKGSTTDMGTHVPLIVFWHKHTKGKVVDDLIDFTDFYPTLANIAGIEMGVDDPIDGRSFFPQLIGKNGNSREWQMCHYQPYWGVHKGRRYVRTKDYKLYDDGSFYNVPNDLTERNNLTIENEGEHGKKARLKLQEIQKLLPPAPLMEGGDSVEERPIYPQWPVITN